MTGADDVVVLLRGLDAKGLPPNERMAVGESIIRYSKVRLLAWKELLRNGLSPRRE
jgi:hypothetical protein